MERGTRYVLPFLQPFTHLLARAQHPNAIMLAQAPEDGYE
jgi:hypothetical protein